MKTYTVRLDTDPGNGNTVTVTPASADTSAATVAPTTPLSFTGDPGGNWATPQTVTVSAVNDDNIVNETFNITHAVSATGGPYGSVTAGNVALTVTDAGKGIVTSTASLSVNDGDGTTTYTLRPRSDPGGTLVVTPSSAAATTATVSGPLTFTSGNWRTAQAVTVTGKQGGNTSITHAVTTGTMAYPTSGAGLTLPAVAVRVADLRPPVLTISGVPAATRTGFIATFAWSETVVGFAASDIQVTNGEVLPHDFYQPDPTNKPNEWVALIAPTASAVTVPVNAAQDMVGNGNGLTRATSTYTALPAVTVPARTVPLGWPLQPAGLVAGNSFRLLFITDTPHRDGASHNVNDYDSFVRGKVAAGHLNLRPYSSDFRALVSTATVAAIDHLEATGTGVPVYWVNGAKLADDYPKFWDGGWDNQADTDRRNAAGAASDGSTRQHDPYTGTNDDGTRHDRPLGSSRPQRGGYASASPVSNSHDNFNLSDSAKAFYGLSPVFTLSAHGLNVSTDTLSVRENDGKATYTVALASLPSASVTVEPVTDDADKAAVSPASLTFTTGNWNMAQTVTVTGTGAANDTATITHTVTGATEYAALSNLPEVDVTVTADTRPMLTVDSYDSANATRDLEVFLAISNHSGNWYVKQTVPTTGTCSGARGSNQTQHVASRVEAGKVNTVVAYSDAACTTVLATLTWTPPIVVGFTKSSFSSREADGMAEVLVVKFGGAVEVGYTTVELPSGRNRATAGADYATTSGTLTFAAADTVQTITVPLVDDKISEFSEVIRMRLTVPDGVERATPIVTSVTIIDNDPRQLAFSPSQRVRLDEGGSATYTVKLTSEPVGGDVTVTVGGTAGTDVTVDTNTGMAGNQSTLTFSASTWDEAQTVTLSAGEDPDRTNDTVTLTHVAAGADYGTYSDGFTGDYPVRVTDDEAWTLAAGSLTDIGAVLTIGNRASASTTWYHKQTAPTTTPPAACSAAQTGATATLTGLTARTFYTFKAYSDAACATEEASVSFSTTAAVPRLVAAHVAAYEVGLIMRNHPGNWWLRRQAPTTSGCFGGQEGYQSNVEYTFDVTAAATHTFQAYSGADCVTELARVTFTAATPTLTLAPATVGSAALNGHTVTLTPKFVTFFAAGGGGGGDGDGAGKAYVDSRDLDSDGDIPTSEVRLSATALALITLTGAPTGLSISAGRLLAQDSSGTHGTNFHRAVEIDLAYTGASPSADATVTVTVDADLLRANNNDDTIVLSDYAATFTIEGPPLLTAGSLTATGAVLTLSNHDGTWYHKTATGGTCSSATLTGLTTGTAYTYVAYSDAACSSANELARVTFTPVLTTPGITVAPGADSVSK